MSPPGVNVLGYLREAKGIGEAARLYAEGLRAAGVPVRTGALDAGFSPRTGDDHASIGALGRSREHPVDLICLNAPELRRLLDSRVRLPGGYRIGVWAWEVDLVPPGWADTARELDEVWAYSRYMAEVLGRALPVPVVAVPLPIVVPDTGSEPPAAAADAFTFLFLFDFHSMVRRKNPLGLIDAFRRAFEPGDGARLVLKTFNGEHRPEDLATVCEAAGGRPDVEVVDRYVSLEEKNRMLASCDCYVSLHRSEGWGLGIGEAMALGRPVIATGFSGNLDFMPPDAGYLVRWERAAVGPGVEVYPAEASWAEPDVAHAAELMRAVFDHPEEARLRAERGRAFVLREFSREAAGAIARRRLELVTPDRPQGPLSRLLRR